MAKRSTKSDRDYRSSVREIKKLRKIGQGSGRSVYRRDADTVVKLGINDQGIHQNKAEAMCSKRRLPLTPAVPSWDDEFRWIDQEYVEDITEKKFEDLTGITFLQFREAISLTGTGVPDRVSPSVANNRFFRTAIDLLSSCNLMFSDMAEFQHWGIGRDGKIKIRDYGFDVALSDAMFEKVMAEQRAARSGNPSARQVRAPTREDWEQRRKDLIEEHDLDKFYSFYYPNEKHLSVDLISVPKAVRGSGNASLAMKDTLAWADRNGVTVTLSPTSEFGASKKRLEKWYRSMGFVPNKGRNKDFRFTDAMIRQPRPVTPRARRMASKLSNP